jgi:hypothetical protein
MVDRLVPMIHVPDVRATVDWYRSIGFTVVETYGDGGGGLSFAILAFGSSQVMFNQDGQPSARARREVDLYLYTDGIDDVYRRLQDRVEVVEPPHDTHYGMREFIIRDLNRFWITFGQSSDAGLPTDDVRRGAVPPFYVDPATLRTYVGEYAGGRGLRASVTFEHDTLRVALAGQSPQLLRATGATTFSPAGVEGATVTFNVEADGAVGLTFAHGGTTVEMTRTADERRPQEDA